jgi:hypothetical protein
LEAFGLRQLSWTAGEALGSLCGGTVFLLLHRHHGHQLYWLVLATVAMGGPALLLASARRAAVRTGTSG